jgi:uncharacterized glyoxalase superfamily protein PhnB
MSVFSYTPQAEPAYAADSGGEMKITPVLYVDKIEDCLPFWMDRLGFEKTVEVPEQNRLGFVILVKEEEEIMLQTWHSLEKDAPDILPKERTTGAVLFVEVEDFDSVLMRIKDCKIILPERKTFYGMREIGVREPGGHTIVFAARTENP